MDLLARIKRLVYRGRIIFTGSARHQMRADDLEEFEVLESLTNATFIRTKRSTSRRRERADEKVHVIESFTSTGILIYTKGVMRREADQEIFYVLISAKRSVRT